MRSYERGVFDVMVRADENSLAKTMGDDLTIGNESKADQNSVDFLR